MQIRDYSLPNGWFPRDPDEVKRVISGYLEEINRENQHFSTACIAPHAGWYYSGRIATMAISGLTQGIDTVAVIGGHLPKNYPVLFAMEDGARTPFGVFPIDKEIRTCFIGELEKAGIDSAQDKYRDNTIEVLLPIIRYFFPQTEMLWVRFPSLINSYKAGKILSKTAKALDKKICVIGSTDLTHYGANYGFTPKGIGQQALDWVKNVNDAKFINAVIEADPKKVLSCAENDFSSCSVGAVLGAMGFAKEEGAGQAKLLEYTTSASLEENVPNSFVGYTAMVF